VLLLFAATAAVGLVRGGRVERAYAVALLAMSLGYLLEVFDRPEELAQYAEAMLYIVWGGAVLVAAVAELLRAYDRLDRTEEALAQHTQRLVAMWEIAGDTSLDEAARVQAFLDAGARAIRSGIPAYGHLARLDGDTIVIESAVSEGLLPPERSDLLRVLGPGARIPFHGGMHIEVLARGGTADWPDIAVDLSSKRRRRLWDLGVRAVIGTAFRVGAEQYFLMFGTLESPGRPFDRDDSVFVELLASFFAARLNQEHALERVRRKSETDALTGLPNRASFRTGVMLALREAIRNNAAGGLAVVDLDRFNEINDAFGHDIGDRVLAVVAATLRERLRPGDIAGRAGGDTFAVLLTGIEADQLPTRVAELLDAFAEPLVVESGGEPLRVKVNIGAARFPADARTCDDLIARAEAALQVAKRGDGGVSLYHPDLEAALDVRRTMRRMLAGGIEANELIVHYQPSIALADGRQAGAEALVRWRHPTRGLVGPDDFIPFAEQHGLIGGIGAWVLQRVAADIADLGDQLESQRISVNLSLNQVDDISLVSQVRALIDNWPGIARKLAFEITESAAMRDTGQTIRTLAAIRKLGIPFALDDFGTGYSSLAHLKRLPIDTMKIDRTFVAGLPGDKDDAALVETQFAIARQFGYETHAEGVEREDQLEWLRSLGCKYAQGFLIARPMPFGEYRRWLEQADRRTAISA
jgi:diguanylate cyclase (GGDEF)-like protein